MRVAIIGGGPSGLTALKHLATAHEYFSGIEPITVRLFESGLDIGGTFREKAYRDCELVSSKYLTAFSDHRFPAEASDFATPESYLEYLESYIAKFGLDRHIECSSTVTKVTRTAGGTHVVSIFRKIHENMVSPSGLWGYWRIAGADYEDWECDAVVVCSGLNAEPSIPNVPGLTDTDPDKMLCQVLHTEEYEGDEFFDHAKTVVILGAGESAMDIGAQAVNHPDVQKVVMCSRDGFFIVPKVVPEPVLMRFWGKPYSGKRPNKPIDTTIASLFDTMYVPSILQSGPLLWMYYDLWIKWMFFMIAGTTQGIDQWVGGVPLWRRYTDSLFLVKSDKAAPFISAGRRKGFWNAVRSFFVNVPIEDTGDLSIEVKGWPTHMAEDGTLYIPEPNSKQAYKVRPDRIVLATGYKTEFPFFEGGEYPTLAEAKVRGIYRNIEDGIAYIGFVRPAIGAIPPLAELQAQLWIYRWLQHRHGNKLVRKNPLGSVDDTTPLLNRPSVESVIAPYELDYALHARGNYDLFTTKRGVDHESYAYQLALDLGAAPTFWHMVTKTSWRCVYTWAMGPNFNTKFRLVGPWANPGVAKPIIEGELYGVVKRTGGWFFFLTYTVLPFVLFGVMSLGIMLFQWLFKGLMWLWQAVSGLWGEVATGGD